MQAEKEAARIEAENAKKGLVSVCVCVFMKLEVAYLRFSYLPLPTSLVLTKEGGIDVLASGYRKRSPWGQWVQYNDKRGRGVFYYNVVGL